MSKRETFLQRAISRETPEETDDDTPTVVPTGGLSSSKNTIGGDDVELEDPQTGITFEDEHGFLDGDKGRPRPREFFHAKQIGGTPAMQVIKNTVTQQLTGGDLRAIAPEGEELGDEMRALADVVEDIYDGPHFQMKTWDDLVTDAVKDMIDGAWAYQEILPSSDGNFDVAGFKPLPFLQVNHNVDDDTGQLPGEGDDDPAFYWSPVKRSPGNVQVTSEPEPLDREDVVVMRAPDTSEAGRLYGQSIATKVREWLELLVDVDVHQKRHYADSHLPAGFLHFQGSVGKDKLQGIEQDIKEVAGDPQELVTTTSEKGASWIPVGGEVADLEAIQQQQWYWKLVLAAAGLNQSEINVVDSSGFAKEVPALQRMIFKNVTKPYLSAILDPHNADVLPRILDDVGAAVGDLKLSLERFDPVQEQIEREEAIQRWNVGADSLAELRGEHGKETEEYVVEIGGTEVDLATAPKYVVDTLKTLEQPQLSVDGGDTGEASMDSHAEPGPPDFEEDPVLSELDAFNELNESPSPQASRQLEDTIEVASSFIVSVAYSRATNFLQLEFERDGTNATYWYGDVPEYRFRNIIQASSKGGYFNRHIRGEYFYARLE